jgi:hypothetical protein
MNGREFNLEEAARKWVCEGDLVAYPEFYDLVLKNAAWILSRDNNTSAEPNDFATDFLVWLRSQGIHKISSMTGLRALMERCRVQLSDPAGKELWEILSEAFHGLAREGKVRRVDAPHNEVNSNSAIWTSASPEFDQPFELDRFEEKVKAVPLPRFSARSLKSEKRTAKVLKPADAKLLINTILDAAGQPVSFGALFCVAKRHVFLCQILPPDDEKIEHWTADLPPHTVKWMEEEATQIATRLWSEVSRIGHCELLCGYFVPKYFLGKKVALKESGNPRRVEEKVQEIKALLKRELGSGTLSDEIRFLIRAVGSHLAELCSENNQDNDLSS